MSKRLLLTAIAGCLLIYSARSQETWDLKRAVEYALANNISVKQADLQVRLAELGYKQNKGLQIPSLNFNMNSGYNFGLSENPATGTLENRKILSNTLGMQSGITLFNWFAIKNTIESSRITIDAEKAQVMKVQNDIALNVAVAYLQILLAKEQAKVVGVQVAQTRTQLELTRKRVAVGALPELNAAELEAQLALDSSSYITTQSSVQQQLLQLKALLSLDAAAPFDIVAPPVSMIPVESIAELAPENVYMLAVANLPQQKVSELRIRAAEKTVEAARANRLPSLSAFGNLNSRYIYYRVPTYSTVINGFQPTSLRVDAGGGNFYTVESPIITQGAKTGSVSSDPLGVQLSENFGQGIGLGIQVPIFNSYRARTAWDRSKINVTQLKLQNDQEKLTLKQDIYRAYNDALAAMQKYNASLRAVAAAEKAYEFAQKRYSVNLLSTYDVINSQNRVLRTRIEMLAAQFDFVFRMKLLEFYKGQGLKL